VTRRARSAAVVAVVAVGFGATGCGMDPSGAVDDVRAQVRDAITQTQASMRGDVDRARARVDVLVAEARNSRGPALDLLRAEAQGALARARAQADATIAQAEGQAGQNSAEVAALKADAKRRLAELRARIEATFRPH